MSDSVEDLVRHYNENVYEEEYPRSIGLFTIPEYPELEAKHGMWSAALDAILTTLRYLAPATLLTIFWGQQSFLFKILKHIDSAFRSIVFSSEEQKQAVLKWLAEAGPVRVEHLDTVWRHGWILCGVLDAALPGACAGHPPTRLSIKHAQSIAEHYLGVEPVFSRQELESNDSLSRHQEWKFATYLERIRQAISKITPPVSKPMSQRTSPETTQFILDYVAKGSGLSAIQINNKANFKIYPTAQQNLDPGEITILIRGPRDTYGMAVIPPILGKAQKIRKKILGLQSKQTYTENVLPVTQGAIYLRNYGKNDMNKTYYIPKTQYDIEIDVEPQQDYVKISYTVKFEGKYLVSISSRGQSIVGSPFTVTATKNIISILERDSFCLEDGEEIDIVDVPSDRKIVLRIVDFVTEKMLLRENGTLEKISDEDAKNLMAINKENEFLKINRETRVETANIVDQKLEKNSKFKRAAFKILNMHRVCKIFNELIIQKQLKIQKEKAESCVCSRSQQGIPDIVNSTFTEIKSNPYIVAEMREKFIVPECISVSLKAEKSKTLQGVKVNSAIGENETVCTNILLESLRPDTPDSLEIDSASLEDEDDKISFDKTIKATGNNPFLNDMFEENYVATNQFGTFVASEYETNNSQNEETRDSSLKIIIDSDLTSLPTDSLSPSLINKNPFIEAHIIDYEKPNTVFKINSGKKVNGNESVVMDPKSELITEEELGNEFVNPFLLHQFQSSHFDQLPMTDFIVGAPVSLPPILRATTPEPEMKSLIIAENKNTGTYNSNTHEKDTDVVSESVYSTALHDKSSIPKNQKDDNLILTDHSLDSSLTETIDNSNASTASDGQFESDQNDSNINVTSRKELWDSAYVSIDDNRSSPDSNNNENVNVCNNKELNEQNRTSDSTISNLVETINIGPVERQIRQTCGELNYDTNTLHEDTKLSKWEAKRPGFMPIVEESDQSISSGTKGVSTHKKQEETDTVSVAFAELNDMYQEYFPNSESGSTVTAEEDNKLHSIEVTYIAQTKHNNVDSASEVPDVKRQSNHIEGTISEVQPNVTESISVSQILHDEHNHSNHIKKTKVEKQFGENSYTNIVLEKKKYWDERIKEIEAKAQEVVQPKKRRISSKQLKNDSLSKRKGKQMIKNFLNAGDYSQVTTISQVDETAKNNSNTSIRPVEADNIHIEPVIPNEKLVAKWKRYWDDKLEINQAQMENDHFITKVPKNKLATTSSIPDPMPNKENQVKEKNITSDIQAEFKTCTNDQHIPIKQELPEEIFKAFETSPKRFFGTSRKQILNKLDTFLGKPIDINTSAADVSMCRESGLVSSRISLFHNMSNTEELPWARRKTQSLHNISQGKECDKRVPSVRNNSIEEIQDDIHLKTPKEHVVIAQTNDANLTETINLKTEGAMQTLAQKAFVKQVCEKLVPPKNGLNQNEAILKSTQDIDDQYLYSRPKIEFLRKKSFSKSETDIFNKPSNDTDNNLDKHKSCDELPKINVKNFISLYESVSQSSGKLKPTKQMYRTYSADTHNTSNSITSDAVPKRYFAVAKTNTSNSELQCATTGITPTNLWNSKTAETVSNMGMEMTYDSLEIAPSDNRERIYLSLSDIELEIIESNQSNKSSPEPEVNPEPEHIEYKNRFKLAKQYFQSLEEIREIKKPRQLNECELLLGKQSTESLDNEQTRPQKRLKKNIKSHSLSSSEIANSWDQFQKKQERCASEECSTTRLVKISEKFNVEDLFTDVTEGKLSRQGSLRGIPHKKAVLEAFRSMENVADTSITSYESAEPRMTDFSKEHRLIKAQRYQSEYPYLPKTDPSKYYSRIDVKASGLISLKELKEKKPRRNSVPDLRL